MISRIIKVEVSIISQAEGELTFGNTITYLNLDNSDITKTESLTLSTNNVLSHKTFGFQKINENDLKYHIITA